KRYIPGPLRTTISCAAKGLVFLAGKASSQVIAATESIAVRFRAEKTTVVRNFPRAVENHSERVDVEKRAHCAVYVGGISSNRGGKEMLEAFASPKIPSGWQLEMAGPIAPDYLEDLRKTPGWERTNYYGTLSPSESRRLIRRSRVGVVVLQNTAAYRESLPTKMFEYMAEGAAIIASDFPLWRSIIERYECGVLVDESSPEAIAKAIARYAEDEELMRRHSRNGLRAAKDVLNWENEAEALLATYKKVMDS